MTTTGPARVGENQTDATRAVPSNRPPRRSAFSPISIVIIAVLGVLLLYFSGVFRGEPRVAVVTSGEGPYWDPVIAGAIARRPGAPARAACHWVSPTYEPPKVPIEPTHHG